MAKSTITKKYSLSAEGVLYIGDDGIAIENANTSELLDLKDILKDFSEKPVKLSISYGEDYE